MSEKPKRLPWLRYGLAAFLVLLLILAIFYQPIMFGVTQFAAARFAQSQQLELRFKIRGSILTSLEVEDLHLSKLSKDSSFPVERLDLRRLALQYNPLLLLSRDFSNAIELVEVKDLSAVLQPGTGRPRPKKGEPGGPLKIAPIVPKKIDLENISLTIKNPTGDLEVRNLAVQFQQDREGFIALDRLVVPAVGTWNNIRCAVAEQDQTLRISGLSLEPLLKVDELRAELAGAADGKLGINLSGTVFRAGAKLRASLDGSGSVQLFDTEVQLSGLELAELKDFTGLPLSGGVSRVSAVLRGELNRPDTWSGDVGLDARSIQYQSYTADEVVLRAPIRDGTGRIEPVKVAAGENRVQLNGTFRLPGSIDQALAGLRVDAGFAAALGEPQRFLPEFNGRALMTGTIGLVNGQARLATTVQGSQLGFPQTGIAATSTTALFAAALPPGPEIYQSVAGVVVNRTRGANVQDVAFEQIETSAGLVDGRSVAVAVTIHGGRSDLLLNATAGLPTAGAAFDPAGIVASAEFRIASITDFVRAEAVEGSLAASGNIRLRGLKPEGAINVLGSRLNYRGLKIEDVDMDVDLARDQADIRNGRIVFDPNNRIEIGGTGRLLEPYSYNGQVRIQLGDLAAFNPFLELIGQRLDLAGQLFVTANTQGDRHKGLPDTDIEVRGNNIAYCGLPIQSLDIAGRMVNRQADLQRLAIRFDPNNAITAQGKAAIDNIVKYEATGQVALSDLGFLNHFLSAPNRPVDLGGRLNIDIAAEGDTSRRLPNSRIRLDGSGIRYAGVVAETLTGTAVTAGDRATLENLRIQINPENSLEFKGNARVADLITYTAEGQLNLGNLNFLQPLVKSLGQSGNVSGRLKASFSARGDTAEKLPHATILSDGADITYDRFVVRRLNIEANTAGENANLKSCRLVFDDRNFIDLNAEATLADPVRYGAQGSIELGDLALFNSLFDAIKQPAGLAGALRLSFSTNGTTAKKLPDGVLRVGGSGIRYRDLLIASVDIDTALAGEQADIRAFRIQVDQKNVIDIGGTAQAVDPYAYDVNAKVDLQDLGFLNGFLKNLGQDQDLGGRIELMFTGKGDVRNQGGTAELHVTDVRTRQVQGIKAEILASYSGMNVEVNRLQVVSPYAELDAAARFNPERLNIPSLTIRRQQNVLTGLLDLPLNLQPGAKTPIALDKPFKIEVRGDRLAIGAFAGENPPVTGEVSLSVQGSGTPRNPMVEVRSNATGIRSTAASTLAAADSELLVRLENREAVVSAAVRQPDIQPLQVQGRMPLDVGAVLESGSLPGDTPLQFLVRWPETNLAFLKKISPEIRAVDGRAAIEVNVGGTVQRPDIVGQFRADIPRFRAATDTVPPIADLTAEINFRRNRITFDQFKGKAGGGPFGVNGSIDLASGTNPTFDVGMTARELLLTRSDNVIARANLDFGLRGPLNALAVKGRVGLVDSRFFQDIDILPLNLPGKPAPQPPSSGPPPKIAIDTPPAKDWTFDIQVRSDSPFLIQSNLARGQSTIHLDIRGTGAKPTVEGFVRVDHLMAKLPYSRVEIRDGLVNFNPARPILDPALNITGTSRIRDYEVRIRVLGTLQQNTVLLDSTPPLAQGDIITLLGTGSTSAELTEDPSLLAGRATFLVARQMWNKFFPPRGTAEEQDSFLERIDINVLPGSQPGTQDVATTFRVTDQWQLVGEIGSSGNYKGSVRYLIRFR